MVSKYYRKNIIFKKEIKNQYFKNGELVSVCQTGLLAFSTNKYPNDGYEFQKEHNGTEQEQSDTKEGKCKAHVGLCVRHSRIHDPCQNWQTVEKCTNHEDSYYNEDCASHNHPNTGEGRLTDCLGVVNQLHTLVVCALE